MPSPDQMGSPFPAARSHQLGDGYGGKLTALAELPIHALGDDYEVEGSGTVLSLPVMPPGNSVSLRLLATPTFKNSAKLICPNGVDYVGKAGDLVTARSDGDSVWRLFVKPASGSQLADQNLGLTAAQQNKIGENGALVRAVKVQKFTSSGTYTPSAGMLYAIIECVGGGGGGGGTAASTANSVSQGSSGGGGGRSIKYTNATAVGASQIVTIGAAGTAGTAGSNAGGAGGDTSVGTLCIGKGGAGGPAETARAVASGGVAGTGDVTAPGPTGQTSLFQQPGSMNGYSGPSTLYGAGGIGNFNAAGSAATGFGAGGAGGHDFNAIGAKAGGAGAPGIVIITEYCSQ